MSNNMKYDLFISVGIDVGADFSWMSIALPNQQIIGKPFKILHSDLNSLAATVSKIKEAEELYSMESRIFLESTGIYHYPLFCYLRDKGFNCSVINPIITKSSTNINIRKVHNDRFDSKKAALIGLKPDLKVSLIPSELALDLRNLSREYYDLMDNRSAYINKLQGKLRMVFPQYLNIFSKITTNTSLTLLENYGSPDAFLSATKTNSLPPFVLLQDLDLHMLILSVMPSSRQQMMQRPLVIRQAVTLNVSRFISLYTSVR